MSWVVCLVNEPINKLLNFKVYLIKENVKLFKNKDILKKDILKFFFFNNFINKQVVDWFKRQIKENNLLSLGYQSST